MVNAALHRRALDAIRNAKPYAKGAIDEFFNSCIAGLEAFRIAAEGENDFDEKVVKSIGDFLPYRAQIVDIFIALAQYRDAPETYKQLHRFFEQLLPLLDVPDGARQYRDLDFDNFKFIVDELFLYLMAILLTYECFEFAAHMMCQPYYLRKSGRNGSGAAVSFTTFRQHLRSLEHRNSRIKANRLSLHADLLETRSHASGIDMLSLMQADFLLFIRAALGALRAADNNWDNQWLPETLACRIGDNGPFEIFARACSTKYFANIEVLLDIKGKSDLDAVLKALQSKLLYSPKWGHRGINPFSLLGFDKLSTIP